MHNYLQASWKRTGLIGLLMFFTFGFASAQSDLAEEADQAYERGAFSTSLQEYIKAYPKIKDIDEKGRVAFMAGESFMKLSPAMKATRPFSSMSLILGYALMYSWRDVLNAPRS